MGLVEKAAKNGWDASAFIPAFPKRGKVEAGLRAMLRARATNILFSHDFAKAFWGSEWVDEYGDTYAEYKLEIKKGMHYPIGYEWHDRDLKWGFCLKALVLTAPEKRLKYIEQFL